MANIFTKIPLSGSTNGKGIPVVATATPGSTIHTGSTTTTVEDEIWLYAMNTTATAVKLTVEWGGTATGDLIELTIPAESGLVSVVPGLIIVGAATALVVRAFAGTASAINIYGYANRIS